MTPASRLATAIDLLDRILAGEQAGAVLTQWGRQSRYAGSKDRAAVRDIVFGILRLHPVIQRLPGKWIVAVR